MTSSHEKGEARAQIFAKLTIPDGFSFSLPRSTYERTFFIVITRFTILFFFISYTYGHF